eukprot:scaffold45693_cov65-Phaeocystis_antarctica.AAC.2
MMRPPTRPAISKMQMFEASTVPVSTKRSAEYRPPVPAPACARKHRGVDSDPGVCMGSYGMHVMQAVLRTDDRHLAAGRLVL